MSMINLVPVEVRAKAAFKKSLPYVLLAAVLGAGAGLTAWAFLGIQKTSLEGRVAALQNAERTKSTGQLLAPNDAERVRQVNLLAPDTADWDVLFDALNKRIPSDVLLTSASAATTNGSASFKLVGSAPSNVSLARFVEGLRADAAVKDVKVESYAFDPASRGATFGISFTLPPAKAVAKPV